jgi:hypothetical protein
MNTLKFGFVLASLSLVACAGADGSPIELSQPSAAASAEAPAAPSSSAAPSASSTPTAPPSGGAASAPAPAGGPSTPVRTMPLQCPTSSSWSSTALLCLETAEGKAGDVVELDVNLVPSTTCGAATDLYGVLEFDKTYFELANVEDQVNCTSRHQIADFNNPSHDVITWQKFGNGSIAGCNGEIATGKVDTVKIRIKPGTPPGDYSIKWQLSEQIASTMACGAIDSDINSEVRVLP